MLNIYIHNPQIDNINRSFLVDLLKPLLPENKINKYGLKNDYLNIVENPQNADYFILPFSWNYYLKNKIVIQAIEVIKKSLQCKKRILIWVTGDYYYQLPQYENIIGLYTSSYRSKNNLIDIPLPVIIRDPLQLMKMDDISIIDIENIPSIGFCGQVDQNHIISMLKYGKRIFNKIKCNLNLTSSYIGSITPPTLLRKKILDILERNKEINPQFIRRKRYQAGKNKTSKGFIETRRQFYNNINNTLYTLCVRGTGNFSARFYETLALGRIPIFINTDCILPFENSINWNNSVVLIDENNINNIVKEIIDFHNENSPDNLNNIQFNNRKIWENYFSFPGYINQLVMKLEDYKKNNYI